MSHQDRHPDSETLMRAVFGELQPHEAASVHGHLSACEQCRLEFEEVRDTCAEFRAFYQTEFKESLPPPPQAWQTFRSALAKQESRRTSAFLRLRAMLSSPFTVRRYGPVAIGACLAILLVAAIYRMREVPAVSASEILNRGVAAQDEALSKVKRATVCQKIRVRQGPKTFVRTLYRDVARKRQVERWSGQEATDVAGRFQGIHYNWADPLSPGGIRDWLVLREENDRSASETVRQSDGVFTVTSASSQDPVQEARFVVRESDYHPVSAYFSFRGQDDVELTELAYSVQPVETIDTEIRAELTPPSEPAPERQPASRVPGHSTADADLDSLEIQARYALHQQQADLGEETQVERTAGTVIVRGLVASDRRRAELRAALAHLQGVRIELETAEEAAGRQARAIASAAESPQSEQRQPPALQMSLAERFPDQEARDAFVLATIECSQRTLSHGFALRKLAERYPAAAVTALPEESRRQLVTMLGDHRLAMQTSVQELFDRLAPLTGPVPQAAGTDAPARPWQEVQPSLLGDLRKMDQIVVELVSSSAKGPSDASSLLGEYHQCARRIRSGLAMLAAGQQ